MAKEETAIDPFAIDLDQGQDMPPMEPLPKGWHKFFLTNYEPVFKEDGSRPYLTLHLQHDETGYERRAFLSWVIPSDYQRVITKKGTDEPILDKEGNPLLLSGSMIRSIRAVISALGGPESGPVTMDSFAQLIGNAAMFLVTVGEYPEGSGELRDQIDLNFGKGIKPC